jgi:hypothetical protein
LAQIQRSGVAVSMLACLALGLSGCGGSGGGFQSSINASNPIIGSWTRSAVSVSGQTVTCPNSLAVNNIVIDSCAAGETLKFTSDGKYSLTYPVQRFGHVYAEFGLYKLAGSRLTLTRLTTGTDRDGNGLIDPATETTPVSPTQVVPGTFALNGDLKSFTLTPDAPATGSGYTVPQTLDGTPVTDTFTRNSG